MTERALSIRQPWVELILRGVKTIEVRTWATTHRGRLWLHAGKAVDREAASRFGIPLESLDMGAVVGTCVLADCTPFDASTREKLRPRHLNPAPLEGKTFGWKIEQVERITPISYRGSLGLMKVAGIRPTESG